MTTTRQRLLIGAVLLVIALLYAGALAAPAGSGQGDATPDGPRGVLGWLGGGPTPGASGEPGPAVRADLHADCLAGQTLTVKGTCVLLVARGGDGLRQVRLYAHDAVTVTARAPQHGILMSDDAKPGDEVKVTVDATGGEIALDCDDPANTCVVTLAEP
jgi:hypothetical protein